MAATTLSPVGKPLTGFVDAARGLGARRRPPVPRVALLPDGDRQCPHDGRGRLRGSRPSLRIHTARRQHLRRRRERGSRPARVGIRRDSSSRKQCRPIRRGRLSLDNRANPQRRQAVRTATGLLGGIERRKEPDGSVRRLLPAQRGRRRRALSRAPRPRLGKGQRPAVLRRRGLPCPGAHPGALPHDQRPSHRPRLRLRLRSRRGRLLGHRHRLHHREVHAERKRQETGVLNAELSLNPDFYHGPDGPAQIKIFPAAHPDG